MAKIQSLAPNVQLDSQAPHGRRAEDDFDEPHSLVFVDFIIDHVDLELHPVPVDLADDQTHLGDLVLPAAKSRYLLVKQGFKWQVLDLLTHRIIMPGAGLEKRPSFLTINADFGFHSTLPSCPHLFRLSASDARFENSIRFSGFLQSILRA